MFNRNNCPFLLLMQMLSAHVILYNISEQFSSPDRLKYGWCQMRLATLISYVHKIIRSFTLYNEKDIL